MEKERDVNEGAQMQREEEEAAGVQQQAGDSCPPGPLGPREGGAEVVRDKVYPAPLHSHQEVVGNRDLFMESLRQLHSAMGTKFMTPVIGGKDLDLHLLYAEVTQRGGLEKVIQLKKWREVTVAFKFPPTTTSASFVLRRYYLTLLHHYEQVYFFRAQGSPVPPPASLPTKAPMARPESRMIASDSTMQKPNSRKRSLPEPPRNEAVYSFTVTGSIDAKFEYGYMVTVKIGSETLRGVLYHVNTAFAASPLTTVKPETPDDGSSMPSGHGRRRVRRYRDPAHPKPNRSAYNFFFAEKHAELKALYPDKEREFSKMIGDSWSKLTEEERLVYQDFGLKDKERYKKELQEYKEAVKVLQPMEARNTEPCVKTVKSEI